MGDGKILQKHKGARNEMVAVVWLLQQGYDVFRNVSMHGDVDIIGLRDGNAELFDVKSSVRAPDGRIIRPKFKESQKTLGVKCICVFHDGTCSFDEHQNGSFEGEEISRVCKHCEKPFIVGKWVSRQVFCSAPCATKKARNARLAKARGVAFSEHPKLLPDQ